jgi:flagellar protein FliT
MNAPRVDAQIDRLISLYLSIERASRDMLDAAQDSDWERVAAIQEHCGALIHQVRRLGRRVVLTRDERKATLRVVRQIVRNEAQIRRLAYPWTDRYEHLALARNLDPVPGGHRAP